MANRSSSISSVELFDEYDMVVVENDLCVWEFINVSDEDDGGDMENFFLSGDAPVAVGNPLDDVVSASKEECSAFHSLSSDISLPSLLVELRPPQPDEILEDLYAGASRGDEYENYEENDKYDDEYDYDDYDDGDNLDDELVPLEVSNKFGRQRIRKLGKRTCPRMNKSKRLPYTYNRPGCVHGKHGLGVQHSYI